MKERAFRPFMAGVIWARYPVMAFAIVLLAVQSASFIRGDVQWRFFNAPEQASITGNFAMAPGATRADSLAMMQEMQRAAEALGQKYKEEYGLNPIAYVIAGVGGNAGEAEAPPEGVSTLVIWTSSSTSVCAMAKPTQAP